MTKSKMTKATKLMIAFAVIVTVTALMYFLLRRKTMYACINNSCVADPKGSYTSADCNSECKNPSPSHPQIFGNWYYQYGDIYANSNNKGCANKLTFAKPPDDFKSFDDYLTYNDADGTTVTMGKQNASLYLGNGIYDGTFKRPDPSASTVDISFKQINCDQDTAGYANIINFGGWGSCPGDPLYDRAYGMNLDNNLCNTKFKASDLQSNCTSGTRATVYANAGLKSDQIPTAGASTGPGITWSSANVKIGNGFIPTAADIVSQNYTGVSLDIEGVALLEGENDFSVFATNLANSLKAYKDAGLTTILTVPGNGVSNDNLYKPSSVRTSPDAMSWFTSDVFKYTDFMCLMFYALVNDTECVVGAGIDPATFKTYVANWNNGVHNKVQVNKEKIMLGFSLGSDKPTYSKYMDGVWGVHASGGITRWAEQGGCTASWSSPPKSGKKCGN